MEVKTRPTTVLSASISPCASVRKSASGRVSPGSPSENPTVSRPFSIAFSLDYSTAEAVEQPHPSTPISSSSTSDSLPGAVEKLRNYPGLDVHHLTIIPTSLPPLSLFANALQSGALGGEAWDGVLLTLNPTLHAQILEEAVNLVLSLSPKSRICLCTGETGEDMVDALCRQFPHLRERGVGAGVEAEEIKWWTTFGRKDSMDAGALEVMDGKGIEASVSAVGVAV